MGRSGPSIDICFASSSLSKKANTKYIERTGQRAKSEENQHDFPPGNLAPVLPRGDSANREGEGETLNERSSASRPSVRVSLFHLTTLEKPSPPTSPAAPAAEDSKTSLRGRVSLSRHIANDRFSRLFTDR